MMAPIHTTLKTQKRLLRKSVNSALRRVSIPSIEAQSRAITERVIALPVFDKCKGVSCYLSMPSGEVATSILVSSILQQPDKTLFVPKIENKEGIMDLFHIHDTEDLASLPSGTWGIKEPDDCWKGEPRLSALKEDSELLDMILLPGVAFDRTFSRLGHGKGYYDRFITTYTASGRRRPLLGSFLHFSLQAPTDLAILGLDDAPYDSIVGLALREQLLDDDKVPMAEHDWKMDLVVTPDEVLVRDGTC